LSKFERLYLVSQFLLVVVGVVAGILAIGSLRILNATLAEAARQSRSAMTQAKASLVANQTAQQQLILSERPWIKMKCQIVKPLTFGHQAWKGKVATITIEETIENVGSSVALDVLSWEDVIPENSDLSARTARASQTRLCDARPPPGPEITFRIHAVST